MDAYVLIQKARPGESLAPLLRSIPGILWADDTTGAYDVIAMVTADSSHGLFEDVLPRIAALAGVTRAIPAPVIGSLEQEEPAVADALPMAEALVSVDATPGDQAA